jgi:tRNA A-37 threonylcarbamoyl transferase component Bud32
MTRLSDATLHHLRRVLEWPEVPGDRYEALDVLGQGGMATVYRAYDRALGREVALKVLRPETSSEGLADRLRREARILARLEHPGIIPLHDAGTLTDGRVFYIMKLVHGVRLDFYAGSAARSEVLRVFLRVCDAVGFAHAQGVIHRDLKPANIMVGAFGEVLVLDWGIAKVMDEHEPAHPAVGAAASLSGSAADTAAGMVLGTPGFMAPEQAHGEVHRVDARTDVYALGAILKVIAQGNETPKALRAIGERASAPVPDRRYQTTAELAADIERQLGGLPVTAYRENTFERAGRVYTRYQTPIILVLTYLAVRLLFLVAQGH